jgi:uncharacterized protein YraI
MHRPSPQRRQELIAMQLRGALSTPTPVNRRAVIHVMLGAGAAAVAGRSALGARAANGPAMFKTTAALNLRSGPGTSHPVVFVMPGGTTVQASGNVSNGYREVWYQNYIGWAHGDFLVPVGAGGPDPSLIGLALTTAAVNLRSGPSTGHKALRVLPNGTLLERSDTVRNGFRYVVHQGLAGWIFDQYLAWPTDGPPGDGAYDPSYATTTAALNLRAEPSTSAKILAVMRKGSKVQRSDQGANGFAYVGYNGTWGWAWMEYLR